MLPTSSRLYNPTGFNSGQLPSTESVPADSIPATGSELALQEPDLIPGYRDMVPAPELFTPLEFSPCTYPEGFYATFRRQTVPGLSQELGLIILSAMTQQEVARLPLFEGACAEYETRVLQAIQAVLDSSDIEDETLATKWHIMACAISHGYLTRDDIFGNKQIHLNCVDLTGMNLAGINLTRANLQWAILTGTNLIGAELTNANLLYANIDEAITIGVNFRGTDFFPSDLKKTNPYKLYEKWGITCEEF